MGNCFKCFEKEDDQQQLIDSDEGESLSGELLISPTIDRNYFQKLVQISKRL